MTDDDAKRISLVHFFLALGMTSEGPVITSKMAYWQLKDTKKFRRYRVFRNVMTGEWFYINISKIDDSAFWDRGTLFEYLKRRIPKELDWKVVVKNVVTSFDKRQLHKHEELFPQFDYSKMKCADNWEEHGNQYTAHNDIEMKDSPTL